MIQIVLPRPYKLILKLHTCKYKYVLSGTPIVNKVEDLMALVKFLELRSIYNQMKPRSIFGFKIRPSIWLGKSYFKSLLKEHMIRHDISLIDSLPEMDISIKSFDYDIDECKTAIKFKTHFLGAFQKLRVLAACNSNKLEYVLKYIKEHKDSEIVIFCDFLEPLRTIRKEYPECSCLTGDTHILNDNNLCVCSTAGQEAVNLQKYNIMINMSPPLTYAGLTQRIKRIYRIGQNSKCKVTNLISNNSVEEYIYSSIIVKKKVIAKEYIGEYLKIKGTIKSNEDFKESIDDFSEE